MAAYNERERHILESLRNKLVVLKEEHYKREFKGHLVQNCGSWYILNNSVDGVGFQGRSRKFSHKRCYSLDWEKRNGRELNTKGYYIEEVQQ